MNYFRIFLKNFLQSLLTLFISSYYLCLLALRLFFYSYNSVKVFLFGRFISLRCFFLEKFSNKAMILFLSKLIIFGWNNGLLFLLGSILFFMKKAINFEYRNLVHYFIFSIFFCIFNYFYFSFLLLLHLCLTLLYYLFFLSLQFGMLLLIHLIFSWTFKYFWLYLLFNIFFNIRLLLFQQCTRFSNFISLLTFLLSTTNILQ